MKNKHYLFSLDFWAAAAHRALWTGAQTVLATVATARLLSDFNITEICSVCATAMILSILKSVVVGLPEVEE